MTKEEIMMLGYEGLEERRTAIGVEIDGADAEQIEALNAELDAIEERRSLLDTEAEERRAAAEAVAKGAGKVVKKVEEKTMTRDEIRNSHEYIEAFAKYIKTGKDMECRGILTENADSENYDQVPVPTIVEDRIRTAWESNELWNKIRKTYFRGNLKVGYENYAGDADVHEEGTSAPSEENISLGIVTMVPANIKKWITVSDEVLAMDGEAFLIYVYDEVAHKIIEKACSLAIEAIIDNAGSSAPVPQVFEIEGEVSAATILEAMGMLSNEATNKVVIASGATISAVRLAALNANYAYDPFFGMEVIQYNKDGYDGAIVGDLSGVQANLPEGDTVKFKFDDLSLAEKDLVKVVGRLYAAIAVTAPKMFAYIDGEAAEAATE